MAERSWSDAVEIARPIDAVWKIVGDPTSSTKWIKGVSRIEMVTPGPVRLGTRFRATRSVANRETTEEIAVTEFQPPNAFAVGAGVMNGGIELRIRYALTPSGSGTRVESLTRAEPKSFGSRIIFGVFWKAVTENDADNLRRLKALVEAAA